jgi:hypothetical protein
MPAAVGSFSLTGNTATLEVGRNEIEGVGSFNLSGQNAALLSGWVLPAAVGTFAFTGNDIGLESGHVLSSGAGNFTLTGNDADLIYTPHVVPPASLGGGGGGYGTPSWKRRKIDQDIVEWVEEIHAELSAPEAPAVSVEVAEAVRPFVAKNAIDWKALRKDAEATRKLLEAWQRQLSEMEEEDLWLLM